MPTGLVEPKLRVGVFTAPVGPDAMEAVNVTLPVKPFAGVTEMAEVLPVVAPAATVAAVPETVNEGTGGGVTVTVLVPVALV
jgi:hypothetical protein